MERVCIVLADAARARIYTFEELLGAAGTQFQELEERIDLVDPDRRRRPSELFSESRPGSDRATSGRGFTTDDHRDAHLRELDRRFAASIIDEVIRVVRQHGVRRVIVAASPGMLGLLRPASAPLAHLHLEVEEIDRDLTRLTAAQTQDYLAGRGLLPARERVGEVRGT